MKSNLSQVFKNIRQIEPSQKLKGLVLCGIEMEKSRLMKRKLALIYSGLTLSSGALILALISSGNAILKSDFWNLLTLMFTDAGVVISHWNEYLWSLMENLPVVSLAFIVIPVFVILLMLNYYSKIYNKTHYNYI